MSLEVGSRLGPYAVTAKIGEGGMGEVYRARDTKLDRDVALSSSCFPFCLSAADAGRFASAARGTLIVRGGV